MSVGILVRGSSMVCFSLCFPASWADQFFSPPRCKELAFVVMCHVLQFSVISSVIVYSFLSSPMLSSHLFLGLPIGILLFSCTCIVIISLVIFSPSFMPYHHSRFCLRNIVIGSMLASLQMSVHPFCGPSWSCL